MAGRRYVRDNRGRFASVGATARGGRLRTEAGNKRATVTGRQEGIQPKNTISRNRRAKPEAAAPAPASTSTGRQRVRGNFRPQNTMGARQKNKDPFFYDSDGHHFNPDVARKAVRKLGQDPSGEVGVLGEVMGATASFSRKTGKIGINDKSGYWRDPRGTQRMNRYVGSTSSTNPLHPVLHEVGHARDRSSRSTWDNPAPSVARRVSSYAATNKAEFVAEVYAGRRSGQKYDFQVMSEYQRASGRRARGLRSQLKRATR